MSNNAAQGTKRMPPTVMPLHGFNTVEFNYLKSVVPKRATTGVSRTAAGFENFSRKSCCAGEWEVLQSYLLSCLRKQSLTALSSSEEVL